MDGKRLTRKQVFLLETIRAGDSDSGGFLDLDRLMEILPWEPSKQSLQFSLRALDTRGLIETKGYEIRRGRRRRLLGLTMMGERSFDPGTGQVDIVLEGMEDMDLSKL